MTGMLWGLQNNAWDLFIEMDADLAHSPSDLRKGIHAVVDQGYNVAIASKYSPDSNVLDRPRSRRFLSIAYNSLLHAFLSKKVHDFSNGYRFYDAEAIRLVCSQRIRYTSPVYLVDALATLIAAGSKIVEFPSTYVERKRGTSKITVLDYAKAGIGATEIVIRHRIGSKRIYQRRRAR